MLRKRYGMWMKLLDDPIFSLTPTGEILTIRKAVKKIRKKSSKP